MTAENWFSAAEQSTAGLSRSREFKMKKIMLNTNVFCRPFDDLANDSVKEEAKSAEKIFSLARLEKLNIISSDVLYEEVDLIEDKIKRESVYYLINAVEKERISTDEKIVSLADSLHAIIKDYNDCLHIAFAAIGNCTSLITCDYELINKEVKIERFLLSQNIKLKIKTPSEFTADFD